MIKIIDYGLGNISAFLNVYKRLNIEASTARNADELKCATKLILPGVGAFDHAMERLNGSGMRQSLDELVLGQGVPVLGICVGMQILAQSSDEGKAEGLGWIDGYVKGFRSLQQKDLLLPHMGWNDVRPMPDSPLFSQLRSGARFYFLHSFYFDCTHEEDVAQHARRVPSFAPLVAEPGERTMSLFPNRSVHQGQCMSLHAQESRALLFAALQILLQWLLSQRGHLSVLARP